MTRRRPALLLAFFLVAVGSVAFAVTPDEMLDDPALEKRAREISAELRCLVCQNQSIDESNADLAKDLRVLVRERLAGGDSDKEVIDYLVSRYGEFVLLKPRLGAKTLFLWGAPFLLLLAGGAAIAVSLVRRPSARTTEPSLSDDEKARLKNLLGRPVRRD